MRFPKVSPVAVRATPAAPRRGSALRHPPRCCRRRRLLCGSRGGLSSQVPARRQPAALTSRRRRARARARGARARARARAIAADRVERLARRLVPKQGTCHGRLVRGEDETCPVSTGGGGTRAAPRRRRTARAPPRRLQTTSAVTDAAGARMRTHKADGYLHMKAGQPPGRGAARPRRPIRPRAGCSAVSRRVRGAGRGGRGARLLAA